MSDTAHSGERHLKVMNEIARIASGDLDRKSVV